MPRFARGSTPWLAAPLVAALALVAAGGAAQREALVWLALVPLAALFFLVVFFRDPERAVAAGVASPADGKVVRVDEVDDPDLGKCSRLAVFMSPLDVHVNRFPLEGTVEGVTRRPGGYVPAFRKDSDRNERVETLLRTPGGLRVKVVQIAGTVARRIVPYVGAGHAARKGERMGLIRLGSRCDLLVPAGRVEWMARVGDRVFAGATSLGDLKQGGGGP